MAEGELYKSFGSPGELCSQVNFTEVSDLHWLVGAKAYSQPSKGKARGCKFQNFINTLISQVRLLERQDKTPV